MNSKDLAAQFCRDTADEPVYVFSCDGNCYGTELVWLPQAELWVYYDRDSRTVGSTTELTLILSSVDGDESGLHRLGDLVSFEACDYGGADLWIIDSDLPDDFELPNDAEVFTVGNPAEGLRPVELTA